MKASIQYKLIHFQQDFNMNGIILFRNKILLLETDLSITLFITLSYKTKESDRN